MYCKKCGNLIESTDSFCKKCGEPVDLNNMQNLNAQPNNSVIQPEPQPNLTNNNLNQAENTMPNQVSQPSIETPSTNIISTPTENNMVQQTPVTSVNVEQQQVQANSQIQNPQPVVNPNVNVTNNAPMTENKNNNFKTIVTVLIVVVVVLGGIVAYKMLFKDKDTNTNNENNANETDNTNTNEQINNNSNNSGTYEYKNFQFTLPATYTATEENSLLELISQTDKVAANMYIHDYITVEDFNAVIDEIKASLTNDGYTVSNIENKKYGGIDWILIHCSQMYEGKQINVLETFASLGNYHVMEAFIGNFGTKTDDTVLTEFSTMYKSATYKGSNQFSASDEKGTANVGITNPNFDKSIIE